MHWKQLGCPSTGEWINKWLYLCKAHKSTIEGKGPMHLAVLKDSRILPGHARVCLGVDMCMYDDRYVRHPGEWQIPWNWTHRAFIRVLGTKLGYLNHGAISHTYLFLPKRKLKTHKCWSLSPRAFVLKWWGRLSEMIVYLGTSKGKYGHGFPRHSDQTLDRNKWGLCYGSHCEAWVDHGVELTVVGHILSVVRNQREVNAGVSQSNLFRDTLRPSQSVSKVILEPITRDKRVW